MEDPAVTSPGPTTACVAGRKTLTTDEANPQVLKDLEKCQKSHISSWTIQPDYNDINFSSFLSETVCFSVMFCLILLNFGQLVNL